MKTKSILVIISAFIFSFIQGCGFSYMSNSGSTGGDNPNNDYQYSSANQEYNLDDLNQYGDWETISSYGRVWRPSVAPGWQPFTNGHWSYDGNDWVWVSYEPFGWLVYHYGSWDNVPDYGWVWIPSDDAWSPACVQWIYFDNQVGWAPRRSENRSWSDPWNQGNMHPWVVVPMDDFNRENVSQYRLNHITRSGGDQSSGVERRQPNLNIVQLHVRGPIQAVKIERKPIQRNPANLNQQYKRPLYHMQIPPQERQKVDRYRPQVEKEVLRKKEPVNRNNKDRMPDSEAQHNKRAGEK